MKTWMGAALLGVVVAACGSTPRDLEPPPKDAAGPPVTWAATAGSNHEARSARFVLKSQMGAFVHTAVRPSAASGRVLGGEE
ncbi:MAG: hypothetical protein RMA76_09765 [Deltaproteobacteria bacterium]|jgi:hypothetical protein